MWANAVECVGHEGHMTSVELRSDEYKKHKYTRSLAQFHFAGNKTPKGLIPKENLMFNATFGEPHLKFICNHEVALYLKLQNGHFNRLYPVSSTLNAFKSNTYVFFVLRPWFSSLTFDQTGATTSPSRASRSPFVSNSLARP